MIERHLIEKVKKQMRTGDFQNTALRAGLSKVTINRFFNGDETALAEDTHTRIMDAVLDILAERQLKVKALEKKTNKILGLP